MSDMNARFVFLAIFGLAWAACAHEIQTDWAYHAIGNHARATETIPGTSLTFLGNGANEIGDNDTVTLYVLTAHQFAGRMDEQIHVRWWDGARPHWIMGGWVSNIVLNTDNRFRDLPAEGEVKLDLWKIDIPPWITQPGDNFYEIQLKGCLQDQVEERFLLNRAGGDFTQTNNLGQIWSASEEFDGQDWTITITP